MDQEILPSISQGELEKYPEFGKLLRELSCHISQKGCSVLVEKDLEKAKAALKQEKLKWMLHRLLYTELQELLVNHQLKNEQSAPTTNSEFYKVVSESLAYAEIGDYVECHPDPNSDTTLLGLKKNVLHTKNPHFKHMPAIQQKLIPEIELRLRRKCETLFNFHQCSTTTADSSSLAFAKSSQLPGILENEKRQLQQEQHLLKKEKTERERQFWLYYQSLLDSLHILEALIMKHRLRSQSEADSTTTEWLTARCDAMCLKIKLFELQLLCDTYYSETVKALVRIRNHLDVAILETQHDLSTTGHALKAYEAVGSGFDELVTEFTNISDELNNKVWAMKELKQSIENK